MRRIGIFLLLILVLGAGIVVGMITSDQSTSATASASTVYPPTALDLPYASSPSTLQAFQLGLSQPLASASGKAQLYSISDASGAVCSVDSP